MADSKTLDKLKKIYKLYVPNSRSKSDGGTVQPAKVDSATGKIQPIKFPSDIQKMYEYYLDNYSSPFVTNRERFMLYRDLDFTFENEGLMSRAMRIYKDESYEIQDGQKPVQIRAKDKKVEKTFYEWLSTIGFNYQILGSTIENIVRYADGFWINTINGKDGITGVTPLSPKLIKDKLEFNLATASKIQQWSSSYLNITNKHEAMDELLGLLRDEKKLEDWSLYFKSYNLGYILKYAVDQEESSHNVKAIPPWGITHFRLSTEAEPDFFPFSKPLFIYSIAVYRGFKTTQMLIDMLRAASFPREIVKIKGDDTMTPIDRVRRVNEVRELIENMSPVTNNRDMMGVGDRIYTMEGLFDFEVADVDIEIGRLGDLEMKRQDLILSTGIPDTILMPSEGSGLGGESASAILYQNKFFQRNVNSIKGAVLAGMTEVFRTHLAITEQYDGEATEFELFMPVNAEVYNSEKIENMQSSFELASDIMNNLAQALGMERGESLPEDVIVEILQNFVSIDSHLLNRWVNKIKDKAEEADAEKEGEESQDNGAPFIVPSSGGGSSSGGNKPKKRESFFDRADGVKATKRFLESSSNKSQGVRRFLEEFLKGDDSKIREAYFQAKKGKSMNEGIIGHNYYFNNTEEIRKITEGNQSSFSQFGLLRKYMLANEKKRLFEEKSLKNDLTE